MKLKLNHLACLLIIVLGVFTIHPFKANATPDFFSFGGPFISFTKLTFGELPIDNVSQLESVNELIKMQKEDYLLLNIRDLNQNEINRLFEIISDTSRIVGAIFNGNQIEYLPSSLQNRFLNICSLKFNGCDSLKSFNNFTGNFCYFLQIRFDDINLQRLPIGIEDIKVPIYLAIDTYLNNQDFNYNQELQRFLKRKNICYLTIIDDVFKDFPACIFDYISLTGISIGSNKLTYIPDKFDQLPNLQTISITCPKLKNKDFKSLLNRDNIQIRIQKIFEE